MSNHWSSLVIPYLGRYGGSIPLSLGPLCSTILTTVKPHNVAALFAIFIVIGVCSITLLPVAIELGVEMTRNPDGSSAVLWFLCALSFRYHAVPSNTDLLPLFKKRKSFLYHLRIRSVSQPPSFLLRHNVVALHLRSLLIFFLSFPSLFHPSQCKVLSAPLTRRTHRRTCTARSYSTESGCLSSPYSFSSSRENRRDVNWMNGCTRSKG